MISRMPHALQGAGKLPYQRPELTELGPIEVVTRWIGGPWGEFFGGQGSGWNPTKPSPTAPTGS